MPCRPGHSASTSPSTSSSLSRSSAFFSGLAGALMVFYMGTASVGTFVDHLGRRAGHHRRRAGRPAHRAGRSTRRRVPDRAGARRCGPLGELATLIVSVIALMVILVFPERFPRPAAREAGHDRAAHARSQRPDPALRRPDRGARS
ncbi:MAG: hypothetical protein WDN69_37780 [Aliidongia sp.]